MDIFGRTVMITGASGGLGRAIALELHRQGAKLLLTARRRELLEALATEVDADIIVADLGDPADVERLVERSKEVDVLVLNAGTGGEGNLLALTPETIDQVIDVNLRSPIHMATAFAQRHVGAGTEASIVLIGSLSGLVATPNTQMYNATKFGLRGFALAARQDLEGTGVGLTLVAPGFIRDAGMFHDNDVTLPSVVRTKSPADVAHAVVRAIRTNPGEIYVSPTELRLVATLGSLAPGISERIQRRIDTKTMSGG
ncbi:MAG: SDR family NAD(P)-dependent oxidoreductase [Actinomycetes bacterium]